MGSTTLSQSACLGENNPSSVGKKLTLDSEIFKKVLNMCVCVCAHIDCPMTTVDSYTRCSVGEKHSTYSVPVMLINLSGLEYV